MTSSSASAQKPKKSASSTSAAESPKTSPNSSPSPFHPMTNDQGVKGRKGDLRKGLQEYYYPHKYAIQITTDSPQWGGLSGCTLEEAISWGKINSQTGTRAVCYCDATIALPLITMHYANELQKNERTRHELALQRRSINALTFIFSFCLTYLNSELAIIGRITEASPSTIMRLAFSLIFPHETASLGLAPLRLPSHSSAVLM